jgi:hypothetical protein
MSDAVITVENLRRYLTGHTSGERFIALRDVLGREARNFGENIFLNGAILGMTQREIRKKFDEIVTNFRRNEMIPRAVP